MGPFGPFGGRGPFGPMGRMGPYGRGGYGGGFGSPFGMGGFPGGYGMGYGSPYGFSNYGPRPHGQPRGYGQQPTAYGQQPPAYGQQPAPTDPTQGDGQAQQQQPAGYQPPQPAYRQPAHSHLLTPSHLPMVNSLSTLKVVELDLLGGSALSPVLKAQDCSWIFIVHFK